MKAKHIYLALCVAGIVLPYSRLIPWMLEGGQSILELALAPFGSHGTAVFGYDLMVAAATFVIWMLVETRRGAVRLWWLSLAALFLVGLSLAFPLFLYLREVRREPK